MLAAGSQVRLGENRDFHLTQQSPGHHTGWLYAGGSIQEGLGLLVLLKHGCKDPTHHQAGETSGYRHVLHPRLQTGVELSHIYVFIKTGASLTWDGVPAGQTQHHDNTL